MLTPRPAFEYPATARNTVKLGKSLEASDFDVHAPAGSADVRARVIGVVENQAPTRAEQADLPVRNGVVEPKGDIARVALIERHRATGKVTNGFVSGFGYKVPCAIASTVAHDSHHMIVVGTDRKDMACAANRLGEVGGGVTFWREGTERALIRLPIAGLMADRPAADVAAEAERLIGVMRDAGCVLNNAYMQHSLLALVVIPELRISDVGLIDVTRFEKVPLLV